MTGSKQHLANFLAAYLKWVADGAPKSDTFSTCCGLCGNLEYYLNSTLLVPVETGYYYSRERTAARAMRRYTCALLSRLLVSRVGSSSYPFGRNAYREQGNSSTMHEDPNRIAFAQTCLADLLNGTI